MATLIAVIAMAAITIGNFLISRELLRRRDRELERVIRSAEHERGQLLDRIMYMARVPWGAPPLDEEIPWAPPEEFVYPETELIE